MSEYRTPTERMIAMLQEQVARLTAERDEARRFACENTIHPLRMPIGMTARQYAEVLGWDCFDTVDKDER